jgi:hypothetical protein
MMVIDFEVALAIYLEIKQSMLGEELQHMVKKRETCGYA